MNAQTIISEVGVDLSRFPSEARAIAFGILLTSELAGKPEFAFIRRLPVSICPHIALTITVFGGTNSPDVT